MPKIPKRISIDSLRKTIGDARTEDILTVMYGPKLLGPAEIKVSKKIYERMLALLKGTQPVGQVYQMLPAIVRLYFRETPKAQRRFQVWVEAKTKPASSNGSAPETPNIAVTAAQMVGDTKKRRGGRKPVKKTTRTRERAHA